MRWRRKSPANPCEARAAVETARRNLADSHDRWPAVKRVEAELIRIRRENHFALSIHRALEGK